MSASRNANILDPSDGTTMNSENYSIPLTLTPAAAGSRLFKGASAHIMDVLQNQNVTMNNHHYGIYPDHFRATPALVAMFNVLSTSKTRDGVEFVSTMEAFDYPIFGTQWHPEKNNFEFQMVSSPGSSVEWPYEAINHSPDAVLVAQYTANFFVAQARQSSHRFADPAEEKKRLIYNWPVFATPNDFVQTYFFPKDF
jgi:gamma-glutamyl hydrolase